MEIRGKNALVLGGAGLVGTSVCRQLLQEQPKCLVVAARRRSRAEQACDRLRREFPASTTTILPAWGDIFVRAEWQNNDACSRTDLLDDPVKRRLLIADILDPLDEGIASASMLMHILNGSAHNLRGRSADIVVDCINTATAVSYQNVYSTAEHLIHRASSERETDELSEDVERLLASLYVPQLVRHIQLLYEGMRRASTMAYIKIGTSGTGGMGFNIPYTHGEERPSRLLLSKAALAGAQSLLTFLMARTPDAPSIVRDIKPTALIGWREIAYGPIRRAGRDIELFDCPPERAVKIHDPSSLESEGEFGISEGRNLAGVHIDTGENGCFSAAEFAAITSVGQMQLVTPEEIGKSVVREILGTATGRDVIAALDGAVMEPSYRGGHLRQVALNRLRELESEHGEAIAFEILGPPRLSKLLYEAYLIKRVCETPDVALAMPAKSLSDRMQEVVTRTPDLRTRIVSIGIGILLADGQRLLRGPSLKSRDAYNGWVDLTADNVVRWQQRLRGIQDELRAEFEGDSSSRFDRLLSPSRTWQPDGQAIDIGEAAAWVFSREEGGRRLKG